MTEFMLIKIVLTNKHIIVFLFFMKFYCKIIIERQLTPLNALYVEYLCLDQYRHQLCNKCYSPE